MLRFFRWKALAHNNTQLQLGAGDVAVSINRFNGFSRQPYPEHASKQHRSETAEAVRNGPGPVSPN